MHLKEKKMDKLRRDLISSILDHRNNSKAYVDELKNEMESGDVSEINKNVGDLINFIDLHYDKLNSCRDELVQIALAQ